MTVKISSPKLDDPKLDSGAVKPEASSKEADSVYEDLIAWAKTRKRQFLRHHLQQSSEPGQTIAAPLARPVEGDAWIATWYTPPLLPARNARQTVSTLDRKSVEESTRESNREESNASSSLATMQAVTQTVDQNKQTERLSVWDTEVSCGAIVETDCAGCSTALELVEDGRQLAEKLKPFHNCQVIAIAIETTGLDPLQEQLRLVQIAAVHQPVILIDLFKVTKENLAPLRELLQGSPIKVFQNAKFNLKFLQQAGLPIAGTLFDTMIAAQVLDAGVRSHSAGNDAHAYNLATLVQVYLNEAAPTQQRQAQQQSGWSHSNLSLEQLHSVASKTRLLLRLREVMKRRLITARLVETAKLEFDCLGAIAQMELNGMLLDRSRWEALRQALEQKRKQMAAVLRQQCQPVLLSVPLDRFDPHPNSQASLNLDSPQQVLEALQQLGVPVENTSKLALLPLTEAYPAVKALLDYRKAAKAVQAFASSLPKHIHPVTGRMHPSYQQIGTATGRMACRQPNLQQIPRDKRFRSCFIPAPGYHLVVADYSQIELRVAAELSGDRRMIAAYQQDEDLHQLTAALIAAKPLDQIGLAERQAAKAVNFGLIYAMGSKGLAEYARNYGVQMSLKQAETFRRRYFEAYQGIAHWHQTVKRTLSRETRTMSEKTLSTTDAPPGGRLRRWQDAPKLTELLNTPVQGTAADITKIALAKLPIALKATEAKLIGMVHDEFLLEVPVATAPSAAKILQQVMEQAGQQYLSKVPMKAEVAIVSSWAEK